MAFETGSARRRRGGLRADINITPLVDVVLVLLIIFMVMTPIWLKQIDLQVPETAVTDAKNAEQVVLAIRGDGSLALNAETVTRDALPSRIRALFQPKEEKVLFLEIDDGANYGYAVEIMDACRGAGVEILGIAPR